MKYFYATGKRKTSIARVRLYENGTGKFTINAKDMDKYFTSPKQAVDALSPLALVDKMKSVDLSIFVEGGGIIGQAQAIRHGISRALVTSDPLLRGTLKQAGFMSRDSRIKERKKPGLRRARRAPQFSKR